ncbi:hypothetical protein ACWEQ7_04155 [Streptomyces sp. NPDC004069]
MTDQPAGCQPQDCCGDPNAHQPPADRPAAATRDDLLRAIDAAYANGVLGYQTPEELLAAYDTSRAGADRAGADRTAVDLPERLEAVLTERYTELGNPFSEMRRHEQGPDGWPASHPVGPHHVAETLRELLADEAQQDEEACRG